MTMTAEEYRKLIDNRLANCFSGRGFRFDRLLEAMDYSLMAGGKRIRPMLVLEFSRITGGNIEDTLPVACAIEMMHTYSLIHDDLPCMDNDDLRRGRPTNHRVYGECTATLAGDALQAEAFGTILRCSLEAKRRADCAEILAGAAGVDGICGGQFLDMAGEGKILSESELEISIPVKPARCWWRPAKWVSPQRAAAQSSLRLPDTMVQLLARLFRYGMIFLM